MLKKTIKSELLWIIGTQIIAFLGGFLIVKLLAIALGTNNYGYYSLCLSISAIVSLLWYGPIDQIILRYWNISTADQEETKKITVLGHFIGIIFIFSLSIILLIAKIFIKNDLYINLISLALVLSIAKGLFSSTFSINNAKRNRKSLFYIQLIEISARTLITIIFLKYLTPELAIIITATSSLISALFFIFNKKISLTNFISKIKIIRCYIKNKQDFTQSKKYLSYGKSFIFIGILASACNYFDRWIIQFAMTSSEVGIYSAISQIAIAPLIAATTITTQFINPIAISKESDKTLKWHYIYIGISVIYGLITLFFYFFSKDIVELLLTSEFSPHHEILPALSFGLSFFYFAQVYFIKAQKAEKPQIIQLAWLVRSAAMIISSSILINYIGLWGITISIIVSSLIFLIVLIKSNNKL